MKVIHLKPKKEESLLRFHPWVFSGAIRNMSQTPADGETVEVRSHKDEFLGIGHYQPGSIAVRIISFEKCEPDRNFWQKKIQKAYRYREIQGLIRDDNNMYRLVHGEGDGLPGLIIDVYDNTAVMQAHSVGMHLVRNLLAEAVREVVPVVENVYYKSETTLPFHAQVDKSNGYLLGENKEDYRALEYGLQFQVDWLEGQKTGFFVDQRESRRLLEKYASGSSVLNMFCYTGGFSVYALRGGAELVHSVDSSAKAIELTRQNVELNFPQGKKHEAFVAEAFRFMEEQRAPYGLIVLDPPAFAKHRDAVRNALKAYRRINAKAMQQIQPGGILFTFSCSQAISKEQFRLAVFSAAAEAKRDVRIMHQLTQPADHPVNIYHPEGEYLKGLVLYVE